ncbi:ribosome-associated translation inhibitor RaiA [Neolewinella aurantiaca]|uniref:Ribosome hibernation promoting factor n=1 Tax=Neolewinella aurantiaca TaxID=2602767 RepID=A0A5C7FZQ1_9BACT|nr:ribosome-associated translation inhibitor RaiA [Neolewinella aurantiaca]TXF91186.1 ribosome-associated translation inhibitor RaiA [Neolewinella aurantiaca]
MQITIHQSGDLLESTKQVITEKITKLETYYDRIERADVYIKEGDGNAANGYTVEARLSIPGPDLFAEYTDPSIKRAIADVAEALRRQIKKHKEKNNDHGSRPEAANIPQVDDPEAAEDILLSEEQL